MFVDQKALTAANGHVTSAERIVKSIKSNYVFLSQSPFKWLSDIPVKMEMRVLFGLGTTNEKGGLKAKQHSL